jgi:hypothetical protein
MITKPTVFVLGAGASIPYGLPSGQGLVNLIGQIRDQDFGVYAIDPGLFNKLKRELRESRQASVDAFLEHRKELQEVGKRAIAIGLIRRENEDLLYGAETNEDWYTYIFNRMTSNTPFERLHENNIGFITFNYDRSLEHCLYKSIGALYGKPPENVAGVLCGFKFIHVHGRVGFLPWQDARTDDQRDYNTTCTAKEIDIAARGIKIISENIDDVPEFAEAQELMSRAKRIAVLGFGYHPVNMKRLKLPIGEAEPVVYGTCMGFTQAEINYFNFQYGQRLYLPNVAWNSKDLLRNIQAFFD